MTANMHINYNWAAIDGRVLHCLNGRSARRNRDLVTGLGAFHFSRTNESFRFLVVTRSSSLDIQLPVHDRSPYVPSAKKMTSQCSHGDSRSVRRTVPFERPHRNWWGSRNVLMTAWIAIIYLVEELYQVTLLGCVVDDWRTQWARSPRFGDNSTPHRWRSDG